MMDPPPLSTQLFTFLAVGVMFLCVYAFVMGISHWQDRKRHLHH